MNMQRGRVGLEGEPDGGWAGWRAEYGQGDVTDDETMDRRPVFLNSRLANWL